MHACMHACVYVCMHACMHPCMHVCRYVCTHEYVYLHTHTCVPVCVCMFVYACMYVCMCVCVCVSTHTHTHTQVECGVREDMRASSGIVGSKFDNNPLHVLHSDYVSLRYASISGSLLPYNRSLLPYNRSLLTTIRYTSRTVTMSASAYLRYDVYISGMMYIYIYIHTYIPRPQTTRQRSLTRQGVVLTYLMSFVTPRGPYPQPQVCTCCGAVKRCVSQYSTGLSAVQYRVFLCFM